MGKYLIKCSMTIPYNLVVEAPTQEAALLFYEGSEVERYVVGEQPVWRLFEVHEDDPDALPHATVDTEGKKVQNSS